MKNKAIRKIRDYEKEGYQYEIMDVEESKYVDKEARESGDRVVIQVAMKRPSIKVAVKVY